MDRGNLQIYFGSGKGKTTAALGQAIREASGGKTVIIVQFLKGKQPEQVSFIQRLEPEIKLFRFQRREAAFEELGPKEREEETMTMKNGLAFAKKVLATGECDVLDIRAGLEEASEGTEIIFTGIRLCPEVMEWADGVYQISALKE